MSDETKLEFWINLYPGDNESIRIAHRTREEADRVATPERVRCVRVVETVDHLVDRRELKTCLTCGNIKHSDEMWSLLQCLLCWEKQSAQGWHEAMAEQRSTCETQKRLLEEAICRPGVREVMRIQEHSSRVSEDKQ